MGGSAAEAAAKFNSSEGIMKYYFRQRIFFLVLISILFSFAHRQGFAETTYPDEIQKQLVDANEQFVFNGKSINPLGIKLLMCWISDSLPGSAAIYLDAVNGHSNQFFAAYEKDPQGKVSVDLEEDNKPAGYFSYIHLGRLTNGIHVLEIIENGGGSGVWTDLLLVSFIVVSEYQEDGSQEYRLVMKREGDFVLGDRYNGTVEIQPHKIVIGADSRNKDSKPRIINFK
jgi:hypothetical protein